MIETHCHLTYAGIVERVDEAVADAHAAGVTGLITVGTGVDDSHAGSALAQRFDRVWSTAGLHPHHADAGLDLAELAAGLRALAGRPKLVAIGEIGLDYHYDDPPRDAQRAAFEAQLALACEPAFMDLPIIIHNRKATDDTLGVLRSSGLPGRRFVFHCFTGSPQEVEAILAFGAMVGFTGIVTFKNAHDVAEASDQVPDDRLLIETDSPYLTPEPHRKVRANEPRYLPHIAEFLAQRRGVSVAQLEACTDANAKRFFRLP